MGFVLNLLFPLTLRSDSTLFPHQTAHSSLAAAALLLTLGSASAAGLLERKVPENICGSFSKESCAKYHFFDGTMTTTACMVNKDNKCVMTKGCSRKELTEPCTRETIKMVEEGDESRNIADSASRQVQLRNRARARAAAKAAGKGD